MLESLAIVSAIAISIGLGEQTLQHYEVQQQDSSYTYDSALDGEFYYDECSSMNQQMCFNENLIRNKDSLAHE